MNDHFVRKGRIREKIRQYLKGSSSDWIGTFLLSCAIMALMGALVSIVLQLLA